MYLFARILGIGGLASALALGASAPAFSGPPADWSKIAPKTVTLFYPGQSSYQWMLGADHKKGNRKVKQGKSCISCHEDEEESIGENLVKEGPLEPDPIKGKNGVIKLGVQAAHDDSYLYFRFQWKTNANREGRMHNYIQYDGKKWQWYGSHRASEKVQSGKTPAIYEDRLAIMLDDGSVPNFAEHGCWLTCHNTMRDMEERPDKADVKAHPELGKRLKKSDVRKYLPSSRSDEEASWDAVKSAAEIAKIKAAGGFVDLMQWRAARSNAVGMADDGYVLEYRLFDKGKNPFSWNVNRKTMTPKFMFDPAKVGSKALTASDIGNASKPAVLVRESNAKKYDPNAGWKKGDILPGRLVSRAAAKGSAADNDSAKGTWKGKTYTLVFRRKLNTGHPADDKIMKVGGVYTIGLAVHDDNVTTRFHHVSFPLSLGIGADADIKAVTVK